MNIIRHVKEIIKRNSIEIKKGFTYIAASGLLWYVLDPNLTSVISQIHLYLIGFYAILYLVSTRLK